MDKKTIAAMTVRLSTDSTRFSKGLSSAKRSTSAFKKQMDSLRSTIVATFAVGAITSFAMEGAKMAAKLEGVKTAFDKLNDKTLLDKLKAATRGTVDDLTLMQKAVQAKNFKIPLDQLATYFKFATNRAIETGESVDYLVDSIITGIGRKSALVLDNLGISAAELQDEMKKTGDFAAAAGNIIKRELGAAGDVADTSATRLAKLTTSVNNLKLAFGELALKAAPALDILTDAVDEMANLDLIFKRSSKLDDNQVARTYDMLLRLQKQKKALKFQDLVKEFESVNFVLLKFEKEQAESFKRQLDDIGFNKTEQDILWGEYFRRRELEFKEGVKAMQEYSDDTKKVVKEITETIKELEMSAFFSRGRVDWDAKPPAAKDPFLGNDFDLEEEMFDDSFEEGLSEKYKRITDITRQFVDDMNYMLNDMLSESIKGFAEIIGRSIGGEKLDGVFDNILAQFGSFISKMGEMMIAYGIAELAFFKSLAAGPLGAVGLIAAGAALVAIGSAISTSMQKASGGLGSGYSTGGGSVSPQTINVQGQFVVKGSDLHLALNRYETNNR